MKLVKELRTTIPTVAYGNIELLTRVEFDDQVDTIDKESYLRAKQTGSKLDKLVGGEWVKLHDFVETFMKDKIASINYDKPKAKPR